MRFFKIRGIQRRWMLNSIGVVAIILLVTVIALSLVSVSYYYSGLRTGLEGKARTATNYLRNYSSREDYLQAAREYVDSFEDSARIELQLLLENGSVLHSSSGLTLAGTRPDTEEIALARENKDIEAWWGASPVTGERVMAVSSALVYDGAVVGIMRYVTTMRLVHQQILWVIGVTIAIAFAILALVYASNAYFVRSIVEPVRAITGTAKRIAAGSYGIQVDKKFDDEIGDLTDAINDMSRSIKQAERMKSEFISSMSHELRTPLTAINGWAETIIGGETRDAGDVKKGMSIIASEARRLTKMVEELLEFSRIEDGRFTLAIEPMDIKAELEDAVYTYREFFAGEGIDLLHHDCEEEFPPLSGDPDRMRQVFCNLLDNAAKHGGSGGRIETSIAREGEQAVITIRDYGPGIPEEELPHVKYKFYKGSSTARGSGIGLAVCEEIIVRHNGSLELANAPAPETGCVVTVHLPLNPA